MTFVLVVSLLAFILWSVVLCLMIRKERLEKNATARTIGKVIGSSKSYTGETTIVASLITYVIDDKIYQREFQVNQLIRFHKIPIGQRKGLPVGTEVVMRYNPNKPKQIFVELDNHFALKFLMFFSSVFALFLTVFALLFLMKEFGIVF